MYKEACVMVWRIYFRKRLNLKDKNVKIKTFGGVQSFSITSIYVYNLEEEEEDRQNQYLLPGKGRHNNEHPKC